MNPAAPLYPPKATPTPEPQGVGTPVTEVSTPRAAAPQITALQNPPKQASVAPDVSGLASPSAQPSSTVPQAKNPTTPRPVMSAKAAINAMYAAEKSNSNAKLIPSAREAVNAASRLAPKNFKSASNLHHGSLQKIQKVQQPAPRSMESTRTSASALIRPVGSDSKAVPVVHTSLKLGASAKPKQDPVVLPAGARMAVTARPVANLSDAESSVMVGRINSSSRNNSSIAKVITSGRPQLTAISRSNRTIRDPQMLSGGRRILPAKTAALPASTGTKAVSGAKTTVGVGMQTPLAPTTVPNSSSKSRSMDMTPVRKLVRPRRFRTAPKNYAETAPSAVPVDSSYAIAEPPKLAVRRRSDTKSEDLGVVKSYRPSKLPEPIGDAAPIGRLAEQRVASGHGGPAQPEPTIKAENTSNYSFSKRDPKSTKSAPYAPADKSPFLKSVTVEKRPLSDSSSVPTPISLPRVAETKPEKSSRKNSYQKKADLKADLPARPTVIVPSSRRSKAPLFFLIIFTIILGAAVGAAVYLCFFQ